LARYYSEDSADAIDAFPREVSIASGEEAAVESAERYCNGDRHDE
jgi:hypothetical protein